MSQVGWLPGGRVGGSGGNKATLSLILTWDRVEMRLSSATRLKSKVFNLERLLRKIVAVNKFWVQKKWSKKFWVWNILRLKILGQQNLGSCKNFMPQILLCQKKIGPRKSLCHNKMCVKICGSTIFFWSKNFRSKICCPKSRIKKRPKKILIPKN